MRAPGWRWPRTHPLTSVFAVALAVRLVNLALLDGDRAFFAEPDAVGYWALGKALTAPGGFATTLLAMTDRMPLYPLLLAAVQSTLGDAPRAVAFIQALIDAGTCTLIAALGAFVTARVGLIAGILAALSPTLIVFSTQILTDTLFLFFMTLMLVAAACFALRPGNGPALLAGLAGGLALVTRPAVAVLLAAGVPLVFALAISHRRRLGGALASTLLFAVGAAAPIAPVLLRNAVHYGSVSLTTETAEHLAFWIVPLVKQRADGTPYQASIDWMESRYRQRRIERGLDAGSSPFERAALKSEVAREALAQLPRAAFAQAWLEGMAVNLGAPALLEDPRVRALAKPSFYATPGAGLRQKAHAYLLASPEPYRTLLISGLLAMLPFLALEAIGLVMLARERPWAAVFACGLLAYFLLLNGPVATAKYRMPMEPVLLVLAAIPLARLSEAAASKPA